MILAILHFSQVLFVSILTFYWSQKNPLKAGLDFKGLLV
nr:MAG TPA: hypothetical protein [Caudoviricetes sp.]